MKTNKIYSDLRNYTFSIIKFDSFPYTELMVYGSYQFDLFDEDNININNEDIVAVFILNYN